MTPRDHTIFIMDIGILDIVRKRLLFASTAMAAVMLVATGYTADLDEKIIEKGSVELDHN